MLKTPHLPQMPLMQAMQGYLAEQVLPFHTPGHKAGKGIHESLQRMLGPDALAMDLTVVPGLGDLFDKQGPIRESQQLAAALYGADESYFLVNGTTGGIYAMILATVGPGEKIIVPRNVHRSVMGALILTGALPVYVQPAFDTELQVAMNVTYEAVASAIRQNPDAKALLLVNPTYYGAVPDLARITALAHRSGMTVLVDEAHGPHFCFSRQLPIQGLAAGADVVVQSTHKILGSLSQASILHCKRGRINVPRLESMLQLVQSSSPNYILLASLEAAVIQMMESGEALVNRSRALAMESRERINRIPGLYCFGSDKVGQPGVYDFDATKLVVTVKELGIGGNEAERWLRSAGKVQAELSDMNNVLFLITMADDESSADSLVNALKGLSEGQGGKSAKKNSVRSVPFPDQPSPLVLSPREAVFSRQERVGFSEAAGRICAETITSYPPGIPILFPGERIEPSAIAYCQALQRRGFTILGPEDPTLNTVEVVA